MAIVAFDLFCGCGGVTYGLKKAGIQVPFGIDFDEECRLTYTQNNPGSSFIKKDIKDVPPKDLLRSAPALQPEDCLLLAACAPCQPFSSQNRSMTKASRRAMLCEVERFVRHLLPDFILLENVAGIRSVPGFSAYSRFITALEACSYSFESKVVDAQFFGVPQSRKRLVILASRHGQVTWPTGTHGPAQGLPSPLTVKDAIAQYPPLKAGERHSSLNAHIAAQISDHNLERIRKTPRNGGSRDSWPKELVLDCHQTHDGHPDVYGRLRWDAPAPTLTTKCTSISNGRFGHPEQHRAISAREAAAIQGFEDSYMFYGGLRSISKQIGNAVPPKLAEQFGRAIVAMSIGLSGRTRRQGWRRLISSSHGRP